MGDEPVFGRGDAPAGDTYRVVLIAVDGADHRDRAERTVTVDR